jgi:hypothetical protein
MGPWIRVFLVVDVGGVDGELEAAPAVFSTAPIFPTGKVYISISWFLYLQPPPCEVTKNYIYI